MAADTSMMLNDLTNNPEFLQELLPAAQRTALLFHLSYLHLAKFPELETIIRERAVKTQLLFASSEAVLLKCAATSDHLVSLLFPMLEFAVKNDKTNLAVQYLEEARECITEIVKKVKNISDRYQEHNLSLASETSKVIHEKTKKEQNINQQSEEIKNLEEMVARLKEELKIKSKEIEKREIKINKKNAELKIYIKKICIEQKMVDFLAALAPFAGQIIDFIIQNFSGVADETKDLKDELSQLSSEKSDLRNQEWEIQVKMTDLELKLATLKMQQGTTPDPVYLKDVQMYLSRIQQILIQLLKFWEEMSECLESLKKTTFFGKSILSDNMDDTTKNNFFEAPDKAKKCAATSDHLVSLLFPMLEFVVKNDKTNLAVKCLEEASECITEIVKKVKNIVDRYQKHNESLASETSKVIHEKTKKEVNVNQQSEEIKNLEEMVARLKEELKIKSKEINKKEIKINQKNVEMKIYIKDICREHKEVDFLAALAPFAGQIIDFIIQNFTGVADKTKDLKDELSQLSSEKSDLGNQEWEIQVKMTDLELKLATLKMQQGTTPDPVYLKDVQLYLSRIQQILLHLLKFCESVSECLESLKKTTFFGKSILSDNMDDTTKNNFFEAADKAKKYWQSFGKSCLIAKNTFSSETKYAYTFLERSLSPGSEEWEQEYKSVMEKLENKLKKATKRAFNS